MENRKIIPIIKTEYKNLSGFTIIDKEKIHISGSIFFNNSNPYFKGVVWTRYYSDITSIPELKLELNDPERHEIICDNCVVTNQQTISNSKEEEIKVDILKITIKKGKIDKDDEVEIFSALRIKDFSGEKFDQNNHRCVNTLEFVLKNARLYSVAITEISNCNGYLYFPMKISEFNNSGGKLTDKLCSLLSFVSANFIDSPYRVLWKDTENYIIQICPGKFSNKGQGVFKITTPGIVQNYLKSAWSAWDNYIGKIDLPALIDYYVLMENQEFIETKILVGCVWMEAIKYEYASNIANYEKNSRGYFLKPNISRRFALKKLIQKLIPCNSRYFSYSERFSFKELIQEIYNYFKISDGDLSFVKYRNEIVHQGKISLPFEDKFNLYNKLIFSIESILLKILDYKGDIYDRFKRKPVKFL